MSKKLIGLLISIMLLMLVVNPAMAAGSVTFNDQTADGSVTVAEVNYDSGDYVVVIEDSNGIIYGHTGDLTSNQTDLQVSLDQTVDDTLDMSAEIYSTDSTSDFGGAQGISDNAIVSPSDGSGGDGGGDGSTGDGGEEEDGDSPLGGIIPSDMDKNIVMLILIALVILIFVSRR